MDIHAIDTVSTTQRPFDSTTLHTFSIREPGSAITHGIAMVFALIGAIPLMRRAVTGGTVTWIAAFIFCVSMILLYGASTAFLTFDINPRVNTILKKADHMMISVFIAGSYTPICLLVLPEPTGLILLAVVWGLALAGIIIKSFFVFCPKWVSSILYIGMGWTCLLALGTIFQNMDPTGFAFLFVGGLIYTIGGVIYALKLPVFDRLPKNFGNHEIFHLFVMAGSLCHYIVIYSYVLA